MEWTYILTTFLTFWSENHNLNPKPKINIEDKKTIFHMQFIFRAKKNR